MCSLIWIVAVAFLFSFGGSEAYLCYYCVGANCGYTYGLTPVQCTLGCQTIKTTTGILSSFSRGCIQPVDYTFVGCTKTNPQKCNCYGDYCNYGYSTTNYGDYHPYAALTTCYYCARCTLTYANTPTTKCVRGCATDLYKTASGAVQSYSRGCVQATDNLYTGCGSTSYDTTKGNYKQRCFCRGNYCNIGTPANPIGKETGGATAYTRCHYCIPKSYTDSSCNGKNAGTFVSCRYGCRKYERKTVTIVAQRTGSDKTSTASTVQKDCAASAFTRDACTASPKDTAHPRTDTRTETTEHRCVCRSSYCNGSSTVAISVITVLFMALLRFL